MGRMATRAVSTPYAHIPNALTLARFALIPVFVAMVLAADGAGSYAAAAVFALAGATDQVDGWLARRWHVESRFGKVADPLADRLMISVAVVLMWLEGRLPAVGALIVLSRDVLLLAGYKVLVPRGYDFEVNLLGKVATWALYASIALLLVTEEGTAWPMWLFWAGVVLAVAAAAQYAMKARREVIAP